jgi:hypothetical protein
MINTSTKEKLVKIAVVMEKDPKERDFRVKMASKPG